MAAIDWELNFFTADPRPLQPQERRRYERAAAALAACASPVRLRLLQAVALGEATPLRAACWAGVPQGLAAAELRELAARGVLDRESTVPEKEAARPGPGSNALAPAASRDVAPRESKRVGVATGALPPARPSAEVAYRPADGHVVVLVAIAVAHGAHDAAERARHALLLRDRRRIAGTRVRDAK